MFGHPTSRRSSSAQGQEPTTSQKTHGEGTATPRRRRLSQRWPFLGLLSLCLMLAGCMEAKQSTFQAAGRYARDADRLFEGVFVIVVIIFVLVEGAIVFFLYKYRERPGDKLPVQVHGNPRAELIWTIIPAVIMAGVAVPTVKLIFDFAAVPPANIRVDACVTGHQWWWEYQYMKTSADKCPTTGLADANVVSVTTANELVIPTKKPIYLQLQSVDVIHSWWVPRLNGKQDVVPGHTNHITIEADTPGTYYGQCSQFCGISHANMRLRVIAMNQSDYDAWLSAQEQPASLPTDNTSLAYQGMQLFLNGDRTDSHGNAAFANGPACSSCHTIGGTTAAGTVGPDLTHVYSRQAFAGDSIDMNDANLRLWLQNPPKEKPGSDMPNLGLSDQEVTALLAFIETLK